MPTTKIQSTYRGAKLHEIHRQVLDDWGNSTQEERDEEIAVFREGMKGDSFYNSFMWMIECDRREAEKTGKRWPEDYA